MTFFLYTSREWHTRHKEKRTLIHNDRHTFSIMYEHGDVYMGLVRTKQDKAKLMIHGVLTFVCNSFRFSLIFYVCVDVKDMFKYILCESWFQKYHGIINEETFVFHHFTYIMWHIHTYTHKQVNAFNCFSLEEFSSHIPHNKQCNLAIYVCMFVCVYVWFTLHDNNWKQHQTRNHFPIIYTFLVL